MRRLGLLPALEQPPDRDQRNRQYCAQRRHCAVHGEREIPGGLPRNAIKTGCHFGLGPHHNGRNPQYIGDEKDGLGGPSFLESATCASSPRNLPLSIILCRTRERFVAEYALRDINKPIGISEYRLAESLPEKLKGSLPTIEELESELGAATEAESR